MMNILKIGSLAGCVVMLAGCISNPSTSVDYGECNYPDSPSDEAPGWICSQPVEGLEIQSVGYSKQMASGVGMMTDVAATEARSRLAGEFSTQVNARLSRLTQDSTVDGVNTNADVTERVQKTLATMTLNNSRIYRTRISPAGNMYVLVGLNKAGYDENIDALVNTSLEDDSPELYRQFLKEEADKSLDAVRAELNIK
ncbi:LPP20 family lipoprotein [Marinomonas sp.]